MNGAKVVDQIREKVLPIDQALYPKYQIIFMFDNAKNHAVFAKHAVWVASMSKRLGGVQSFLYGEWYEKSQQCQIQPI